MRADVARAAGVRVSGADAKVALALHLVFSLRGLKVGRNALDLEPAVLGALDLGDVPDPQYGEIAIRIGDYGLKTALQAQLASLVFDQHSPRHIGKAFRPVFPDANAFGDFKAPVFHPKSGHEMERHVLLKHGFIARA